MLPQRIGAGFSEIDKRMMAEKIVATNLSCLVIRTVQKMNLNVLQASYHLLLLPPLQELHEVKPWQSACNQ